MAGRWGLQRARIVALNLLQSSSSPIATKHLATGLQRSAGWRPQQSAWQRCFHVLRDSATSSSGCSSSAPAALGHGLAGQLRRCMLQRGFATASTALSAPFGSIAFGIPDRARRQLTWWLGGCSVWVFSMVVLGGVTRLTRSGLSMTEWKFTGERPPLNHHDWEEEFAKYRSSPEFKRVHASMTLTEFQFIYWMEYAHRMWGRVLGVAFVVPGTYFAARGWINRPLAGRLGLLLLMGGAQGLVGWWMVRSGLQEPTTEHATPRVSPYRLTGHLASAFTIYGLLVWTTLGMAAPVPALAAAAPAAVAACGALRTRALALATLVAVTAMSGAFVAGNDAGRAYNTFPLMGDRWVPDEYWHGDLPVWRNAFENTAAVQLHHRALAVATLAGATALFVWGRGAGLPRAATGLVHGTAALAWAQATLGVSALLHYVPVSLGSAHQAGALALFTVMLALLHGVRSPAGASAAALRVARLAGPAAALGTLAVAAAVTNVY